MKKPNIKNLKKDPVTTQRIKNMVVGSKKVKITFCIDKDSLDKLRNLASEKGSKYQTLLNHILKMHLTSEETLEERIDKLEKELNSMKDKIRKAA